MRKRIMFKPDERFNTTNEYVINSGSIWLVNHKGIATEMATLERLPGLIRILARMLKDKKKSPKPDGLG